MRLIRMTGPVVLVAAIVFAGVGGSGKNSLAKSGAPFVSFDICLQDESNGNILSFNSVTGAYSFTACQQALTVSGVGTVRTRGCVVTLEVNAADRRLVASTETCLKLGSADLRLTTFPNQVFSVFDKNTANSICTCGTPPPAT